MPGPRYWAEPERAPCPPWFFPAEGRPARRTTPDDRSEPGGSAGKLPGTRRARRGGHPPKSHPRMELTELRESAAPGRGDGQGARGAAGGRTAGLGARERASRRALQADTRRCAMQRADLLEPIGAARDRPRLARQQPGPRPGAEAEQGGGGGEGSSAARGDLRRNRKSSENTNKCTVKP